MQVNAAHAKSNFAKLLDRVEKGETVQITRYKKLIANLVPVSPSSHGRPKLGTAPDSVKILDPNWAKPMTVKQIKKLFRSDSLG